MEKFLVGNILDFFEGFDDSFDDCDYCSDMDEAEEYEDFLNSDEVFLYYD